MNFQELIQRMTDIDQPVTEADKAKKDYDGDGEVESGKDEYYGSRMKAAFPKDKEKEKAVDEAFIDECGMDMPGGMMGMRNEPPKQSDSVTMNVSMNGSGAGGIADLMSILRNIDSSSDDMGMDDAEIIIPMDGGDKPKMIGDEYKNEPDEMYMQHDMNQGGDLNRPKKAYPAAQRGDNAMAVESLKNRLGNLYEAIKSR
jgi:hypothetical protein